jgi:dTDP-D-glucose 4,6-dehydratase
LSSGGEGRQGHHISAEVEIIITNPGKKLLECGGVGWHMFAEETDRNGHSQRYPLADSLLWTMGYAPGTRFSDGLRETVHWFSRHHARGKPLRQAPGA